MLGLPHRLLEAVDHSALPRYEGDAGSRWKIEGLKRKRQSIILQGDPYPQNLPDGLLDVASTILKDWILYGAAGFERNVADAPSPLPALMYLPGWSIQMQNGRLLQAEQARQQPSKPISRAIFLPAPKEQVDRIRASLEKAVEIAIAEREAMNRIPEALSGKAPIRPLDAMKKLEVETFRITRELGYVPSFSEFKISPDYRLIREIRMRRLGLVLRSVLIAAVNDSVAWFSGELGDGWRLQLGFDEAWSLRDLDDLEQAVQTGSVDISAASKRLTYSTKGPRTREMAV